jgi:hypothetical protein
VNVGRVRSHATPQSYGCVMTDMRRSREPLHDRSGSHSQSDQLMGADVRVVKQASEPRAK